MADDIEPAASPDHVAGATPLFAEEEEAVPEAVAKRPIVGPLAELAILMLAILGAIALGLGISDYLSDHPYVLGYVLAYFGYRLADLLLHADEEGRIHGESPLKYATRQLPLLLLFAAAPFERTYIYGGESPRFVAAFGLLMELAGMWLALGARFQLAYFLSQRTEQGGPVLARTGFYRYVRHPGYAGASLVLFAWPFEYGAPIVAVLTLILLFVTVRRRILREEQRLKERFGEEYEAYMREADALIPNVW
jgi:protein-S-isoprenylcysteine O-methyltransferase Ste14